MVRCCRQTSLAHLQKQQAIRVNEINILAVEDSAECLVGFVLEQLARFAMECVAWFEVETAGMVWTGIRGFICSR